MARYNAGRRELVDQARAELLALGQSAIKAIRETLDGPDPALRYKAAEKTLELIGCDGPPPGGSVDPGEIAAGLEKSELDLLHQADMNRIFRRLTGGA
jgi:hypothetical protein